MKIIPISSYSFGANTYLLCSGKHAFVIDPASKADTVLSVAKQEGVVLDGIILTHGHFDHITSVDSLRDATGVDLFIHEGDAEMLGDSVKNAFFSFFGRQALYRPAEKMLYDGQILSLGDQQIKVIHTPGHSKGSICLFCNDFLITGDTLFADSVGRCDLWGGNQSELLLSIKKLRALPQQIMIYPGHGAPERLGIALDNAAYYL